MGQLTSEVRAGYSAQYAYDANGNRLSKTVNGVSESYSYDSADKLLAVSGGNDPRTFAYDAAGRMTSVQRAAGTTFLAYDFDDRVVQIQDPTGVQNHTYDSLDARISSTFGGVTRNYRRSGAGSWAPVVSDGTALFSPGISERRGGTTTYLHADSGSTDLQTTAAGAALAGREFSAFGELVQSAGTWQGQSGFMGLEDFGGHFKVGNGGGVYDPGTGRVGTPGAGGRNDYAPGSGGPSNRLHPTIDFVPADEGGHYTAPWEWEDFFAGWGDTLTGGGTRQVRKWIGCDDVVDSSSGSYRVGEIVGEVNDLALGGKGRAGKVAKKLAEEAAEKGAKYTGRHGNKQHRDSVEAAYEEWKNKGGKWEGGGGKGKKEKGIRIPEGGYKKLRYPDVWVKIERGDDVVDVFVQVVRFLKDDKTLPKREREAWDDLKRAYPNAEIYFRAAGE